LETLFSPFQTKRIWKLCLRHFDSLFILRPTNSLTSHAIPTPASSFLIWEVMWWIFPNTSEHPLHVNCMDISPSNLSTSDVLAQISWGLTMTFGLCRFRSHWDLSGGRRRWRRKARKTSATSKKGELSMSFWSPTWLISMFLEKPTVNGQLTQPRVEKGGIISSWLKVIAVNRLSPFPFLYPSQSRVVRRVRAVLVMHRDASQRTQCTKCTRKCTNRGKCTNFKEGFEMISSSWSAYISGEKPSPWPHLTS